MNTHDTKILVTWEKILTKKPIIFENFENIVFLTVLNFFFDLKSSITSQITFERSLRIFLDFLLWKTDNFLEWPVKNGPHMSNYKVPSDIIFGIYVFLCALQNHAIQSSLKVCKKYENSEKPVIFDKKRKIFHKNR